MKHTTIYLLLSVAIIFSSCEKVIDLPLDAAAKKYVIEGAITDMKGGCRVLISQTKNFNEDNSFESVSGAAVSITDGNNNTISLPETSPGIYADSLIKGMPGRTYAMHVNINGTAFESSSTMPFKVNMDSLYVTDDFLFGEVRKTPNVEFRDPRGTGNNYRFILYVNGVKRKNIYISNDSYSDGNFSSVKLFLFGDGDDDDDKKIKSGDKIGVDMLCISPDVYKYWYSLDAGATGNNSSASPANPVSNISGGALGYFSAHTVQSRFADVP
jgi:hypothetical protein